MKYEGTRPSGADKDVEVHKFVVGKEEMKALKTILSHYLSSLPKTTETQNFYNRLNTMRKTLDKVKVQ